MSGTYKKKEVYSLKKEVNMERIQSLHCDEAMCNGDVCVDCINYPDNLDEFKSWFVEEQKLK